MLVDNKFIYLSLPRCASTSFFISCIRSNFDIKHGDIRSDKLLNNINLANLTNMEAVYQINHFHETVTLLKQKFGENYDIISVRRNKHERFISYFNHCIGELKRAGNLELSNKLLEMTSDDVFFYETNDLINRGSKIEILKTLLKNIGYYNYDEKLESLLLPIFTPMSVYHNNDPKIIWFEFEKLNKMEKWIREKTQKDFKLEVFGSSKEYKSKLILSDSFIKKYDSIYNYYDTFKNNKSLI